VDGGLPSRPRKDSRAKGKFWGAAKFAFRPMPQKYQKCLNLFLRSPPSLNLEGEAEGADFGKNS
jgi:hypothetical protein